MNDNAPLAEEPVDAPALAARLVPIIGVIVGDGEVLLHRPIPRPEQRRPALRLVD